jgi:hypothetical protein
MAMIFVVTSLQKQVEIGWFLWENWATLLRSKKFVAIIGKQSDA